ncbi:MAG: choice-of-anchor Q domain-containing protein [Gammaproteobacteria bacterium]
MPRNSTVTLTTVNNADNYGPTGLPVIRGMVTIDGNNSTIKRAPTAPSFRVLAIGSGAECTLRETTISGGNSSLVGGGISNDGVLILVESTLSGNRTSFIGGGVFNDGTLQVIHSTISGNRAAFGAGVANGNDPNTAAVIRNSTISANEASDDGGGVFGVGDNTNVGIFNSTLSGNQANDQGGGVLNEGSLVTLIDTVITGNTALSGSEVFNCVTHGGIVNGERLNVLGHKGLTNVEAFVDFTPGVTDITATSNGNSPTALNGILNTTLANNGGPTRTHALVAGSPAVDAVNDGTCPPPVRDQRGVRRPQDGNGDGGTACDIGSFERR